MKVRITEGFLVELVKEYPWRMKNGSNKREVKTSAGSNNRESTVIPKSKSPILIKMIRRTNFNISFF